MNWFLFWHLPIWYKLNLTLNTPGCPNFIKPIKRMVSMPNMIAKKNKVKNF